MFFGNKRNSYIDQVLALLPTIEMQGHVGSPFVPQRAQIGEAYDNGFTAHEAALMQAYSSAKTRSDYDIINSCSDRWAKAGFVSEDANVFFKKTMLKYVE